MGITSTFVARLIPEPISAKGVKYGRGGEFGERRVDVASASDQIGSPLWHN